ncbi:hypothetical protein [Aquibaculum sediminis]|uniref:hypothetical protein n=1 Tax=Aquibaculum sediminis TaxID=3231907 RepID=UPI0034545151
MASPTVKCAEKECLAAAALEAVEALLQEHDPEEAYDRIAEAVRCVIRLRDQLIAEERRGGSDSECLAQVNSLLSLAASAEYPLVGLRWERVCMVRDELRQLLSEVSPEAEGPHRPRR